MGGVVAGDALVLLLGDDVGAEVERPGDLDVVDRPLAVAGRIPLPIGYAVLVVLAVLGLTLAMLELGP